MIYGQTGNRFLLAFNFSVLFLEFHHAWMLLSVLIKQPVILQQIFKYTKKKTQKTYKLVQTTHDYKKEGFRLHRLNMGHPLTSVWVFRVIRAKTKFTLIDKTKKKPEENSTQFNYYFKF